MITLKNITLSMVEMGKNAKIIKINTDDYVKRRLLDIGFSFGTVIKPLFKSPGNNPIAYQIKGAIVAIRKEEADKILVEVCSDV